MRMKTALLGLALVTAAASQAAAQTLEDRIRSSLEETGRPLTIGEEGLEGAGGSWIVEEASSARFTLVGESHLTAETPAFTAALLRELEPAGYSTYVLESGPVATRLMVEAIEESGLEGAERLLTEHPFSIAFLDQREEMRTVEEALDLGYDVWGIDQEFVGSPRLLLSELMELAEDGASRRLAASMLERARDGFAHFAKTGDDSRGFIMLATSEDFDRLRDSFQDEGGEALRIIEQLRASSAVYRAYRDGRYYENNSTRISLMKRNLLSHLEQAGESPLSDRKMVFKAGTYHMGRGLTPMKVLDVGNFASELAIASGSRSFHLVVSAKGKVDAEGTFAPWDSLAPHYEPMFELTGDDSAMAFDLRPLRPLLTRANEKSAKMEELERLALRFDAVVMLPRFHPADPVVPMPGR